MKVEIKPEFKHERQGRVHVLYAGLLDAAHDHGLRSIETELSQVPSAENGQVAIARAIVRTEAGKFTGIGDASPASVGKMIIPHIIRMAETRAKARALRDAINVGTAAFEEMGADEEESTPLTDKQYSDITELAGKLETLGNLAAFVKTALKGRSVSSLTEAEADYWIKALELKLRDQEGVDI